MYLWNPSDYERNSSAQERAAEAVIARLNLRGIERSLKPRGRMLIQCSGRGSDDDIFGLSRKIIKNDRWAGYFRGYSNPHGIYGPEEYHGWLSQGGLKEVSASLTVKDMLFSGRSGLEGFIRNTWLSLTSCIPEEKREQLIAEIADRYLDLRPIEGGAARVGMAVLEVEARRPD